MTADEHGAATPTKGLIAARADVVLMEGYHSPQLEVSYRLNTNEAPELPPAQFFTELADAIGSMALNRYPDDAEQQLRAAIARHHGVAPEMVHCGNGSNEVLQAILLAYGGPGRAAAVFEPTYAMHSHIARITGTEVLVGERGTDFLLDPGEFGRVMEKGHALGAANPSVTFLCSPNNPSGRLESPEMISMVIESAPGLVVVDEAYGQFARESALSRLATTRNLVVVRTFSKTWALAGLRLGFAIADPEIVLALDAVSLPYHLDMLKQRAGVLALQFEDEMAARTARLVEERGRIASALNLLDLEVCPSDANFILFRLPGGNAKQVWRALIDDSVLVRDVSSWPRLKDYLRVTIGTPAENTAFLASLQRALGDPG